MNELDLLWKTDEQLGFLPMTLRAIVMFVAALLLLRLGGIRIFGQKSALDNVIVIMLGAVMARGIVGASSLHGTIIAATAMVLLNRVTAWACQRNAKLNSLVKGQAVTLFENGKIIRRAMESVNLSETDLMESLHLETNKESFQSVEKVILEINGRISFILKDQG